MKYFLTLTIALLSLVSFAQVTIEANQTEGCVPLGIVISVTEPDAGTITSYEWTITYPDATTFTSSSSAYTDVFSIPGTYDVSITINGTETLLEEDFITVHAPPVADFTVDDDIGCFPHCVTFTDLSSVNGGSIVEWSWDFGNGVVSSDQNPVFCYDQIGQFSPILSLEDEFGCFADVNFVDLITVVDDFPTMDITPSSYSTCNPPSEITFSNNSTGSSELSCSWDFADGFSQNTLTASDVSHVFNNVGSFNVCVTAENSIGCVADSCLVIDVVSAPIPSFTVTNETCAGMDIQFTDTSSPVPTSYEWDFDGDGVIDSTDPNPTYSYNGAGTFYPSVNGIYSANCEGLAIGSVAIDVAAPLNANFSASEDESCIVPFDVAFTNSSTGPGALSYEWLVDSVSIGTDTDLNYSFTDFGLYDVGLILTNDLGCVDTLYQVEMINLEGVSLTFSNPSAACTGEVVEIEDIESDPDDPIITYDWDFDGDGIPEVFGGDPSYTYDEPGDFVITVEVETTSGCNVTLNSPTPITVYEEGNTDFTTESQVVCAGEPFEICLEDPVPGNFYNWDFGDGTGWQTHGYLDTCIVHEFQDTGLFDLTLSVYNPGCNPYLNIPEFLYVTGPVALFDYGQNCLDPLAVEFFDVSIAADSLIWDFGDGSPLVYNDLNPIHVYADLGSYTVNLTVFNDEIGCPDETSSVVIAEFPTLNTNIFSNVGCPPLNVGVESSDYTIYNGWEIDYGNGQTMTATWNEAELWWDVFLYSPDTTEYENYSLHADFWPIPVYEQAGIYDISFQVTDQSGCTYSFVEEDAVTVWNDVDFADFDINVTDQCDSIHVELEPIGNGITTFEWEYGDGNTDQVNYITDHEFEAPWDYPFTITFTAYDINGCTSTITHDLGIIPPPDPSFNALTEPLCRGDILEAEDTSLGEVVSYSWDFGDPGSGALNTSTDPNVTHEYSENGVYTVCLTVENSQGCAQTYCEENLVSILSPDAVMSYDSNINNCLYGVNFVNETDGNVVCSEWIFGDGQEGGGPAVFHTYPLGVYDVELVVCNEFGCYDTTNANDIFNLGNVIGQFNVVLDDISCAPFLAEFEAFNTLDNTFEYFWGFGDGFGDSGNNTATQHDYELPGEYCPSLIMTDENGCTVLIECEEPIVVDEFTFETSEISAVCEGETVVIEASGADNYSWDLPEFVTDNLDGTYNVDVDETTSFILSGFYEDCQSDQEILVEINQLPIVDLLMPEGFCFETDAFDLDGGSPNDIPGVYFIDGIESTQFDPSNTAEVTYEVTYVYTDEFGCVNSDTTEVIINALPIVALDDFSDLCANNDPLVLAGGTPLGGIYEYAGAEITEFDPTIGYGEYDLIYTFTDANGCQNSDSNSLDVNPVPEANFQTVPLCFQANIWVENTSSIAVGSLAEASWDFDVWGTSDELQPDSIAISNPGTFTFSLEVVSDEGCINSTEQDVQIFTAPVADFTLSDQCLNEPFDFIDVSEVLGGAAVDWQWVIDGNTVGYDDSVNNFEFDAWGEHEITLLVESNEGCLDSITQIVNAWPLPEANIMTSDLCLGDIASFTNASEIIDGTLASQDWLIDGTLVETSEDFEYLFEELGVYDIQLDVYSDQGCLSSTNEDITVFASPIIDFYFSEVAGCALNEVLFSDSSYTQDMSEIVFWSWTADGSTFGTDPESYFYPNEAGAYDITLTVVSENGCSTDSTINNLVNVFPLPDAGFSYSADPTTVEPFIFVQDESEGATQWDYFLWDESTEEGPNLSLYIEEQGVYPVTQIVSNEYGCLDSITIDIIVLPDVTAYIPSAFTPDNDGVNDVFHPVLFGFDIEEYEFTIFNRWGQEVFSSNNPEEAWLGNVERGEYYAPDGVYIYQLTVSDKTLRIKEEFSGHVTLIR